MLAGVPPPFRAGAPALPCRLCTAFSAAGNDAAAPVSDLRGSRCVLVPPRIARSPRRGGVGRGGLAVALERIGPPIQTAANDIVGGWQFAFGHPAVDRARGDAFLLGEIALRQPPARAAVQRSLQRVEAREDGVDNYFAHGVTVRMFAGQRR